MTIKNSTAPPETLLWCFLMIGSAPLLTRQSPNFKRPWLTARRPSRPPAVPRSGERAHDLTAGVAQSHVQL